MNLVETIKNLYLLKEETNKTYNTFGPVLKAPKENSPLYHVTASKNKTDDSKFRISHERPVTWFVSGEKGYNGHNEVIGGYNNGPTTGDPNQRIHIRKLKKGIKFANESDVHHSMSKVLGNTPEYHKKNSDPVYAMLDKRFDDSEDHKNNVDKIVNHLKSKGFHGVIHSDYSMADNRNDQHSVALFNPNEHSEYVKTTNKTEDITHYQKEYDKNVNS